MTAHLIRGDARRLPLATGSVQCVVSSPPFWNLRNYGGQVSLWGGDPDCDHVWVKYTRPGMTGGTAKVGLNGGKSTYQEATMFGSRTTATCSLCQCWRGELGSEPHVQDFIAHLVEVCREVWRVMRDDACFFLNMGDSYGGSGKGPTGHNGLGDQARRQGFKDQPSSGRAKSLALVPERLAIALSDDGWVIRSRIAWCKAAPMPESVRDRPTSAWEHIWMLSKRPKYYWDQDAVRVPQSRDWSDTESGGQIIRTGEYRAAAGDNHRGFNQGPNPAGANLRNFWLLSPDPYSTSVEISRERRVGADAAGDDIRRITSPDCPLHAGLSDQESTAQGGGHGAVSVESRRSRDTRNGPSQAPLFEPAPTARLHVPDSVIESSGSSLQSCAPAATGHSNGIHRTGLGLETTQPYIPSAESLADIGHIAELRGSFDLADRSDGNSSEPGGSDDHPSAQIPPDNAGISSQDGPCTCEFYQHYTEKSSHFATFPREIPRRCILAATSEYGACAACGAPWRRTTETQRRTTRPGTMRCMDETSELFIAKGSGGNLNLKYRPEVSTTTTGWQPTCTHRDTGVRPCIVLDPFSGSGTTAFVAAQLGRTGIGVELSQDYIAQAQEGRLAQNFLPMEPAPSPVMAAPEPPPPSLFSLLDAPRAGGAEAG